MRQHFYGLERKSGSKAAGWQPRDRDSNPERESHRGRRELRRIPEHLQMLIFCFCIFFRVGVSLFDNNQKGKMEVIDMPYPQVITPPPGGDGTWGISERFLVDGKMDSWTTRLRVNRLAREGVVQQSVSIVTGELGWGQPLGLEVSLPMSRSEWGAVERPRSRAEGVGGQAGRQAHENPIKERGGSIDRRKV